MFIDNFIAERCSLSNRYNFAIMALRSFPLLLWALFLWPLIEASPPPYNVVYFDLPDVLEPVPIPSPTPDLAALPGYPLDPNRLTLAGVVYQPDPLIHGSGPYPAILVLHGSGGLWSSDLIANGPALQFRDWAEVLSERGYLCLMPDSFNPRGIPADFKNRRPHHDPTIDDVLCSPNYERPKDVVAALQYLASRTDVDPGRIGMLAFSHGAQAGLNVLMDRSVNKSPYTVRYIDATNTTVSLPVPDPIQIPPTLPFPKVFACYYPGCGHYGYHGSSSSIAANRYMPDQDGKVVMFHGTLDSLLGVDDPDLTPMTGNLYPIKFVESSQLQADALGIANPFAHHLIFDQADHSFDNSTIEPEANWNTSDEEADEKAKRLARDESLKWFAYCLKPHHPNADLSSGVAKVSWHGQDGINYQVLRSSDLVAWTPEGTPLLGTDGALEHEVTLLPNTDAFFKLEYSAPPPPLSAPENSGYFRSYGDFSY